METDLGHPCGHWLRISSPFVNSLSSYDLGSGPAQLTSEFTYSGPVALKQTSLNSEANRHDLCKFDNPLSSRAQLIHLFSGSMNQFGPSFIHSSNEKEMAAW